MATATARRRPKETSEPSWNADSLRRLPPSARQKFLDSLNDEEMEELSKDYDFWARPAQREPTSKDWSKWLLLGGRGAGKTWPGAQMTKRWAESGKYPRIALVAQTPADARDVMIEGESGILALSPDKFRPRYYPSKRLLIWPNGVRAIVRSGAEPESLRGLNSYKAWLDELAAWKYMNECYDNIMLGLRLGDRPQAIITTTPKPKHLIRALLKDPTCVVTTETTYANRANLSEVFYNEIITKYEGTRLGQQELEARVLEEVPGAMWRQSLIDAARIVPTDRTITYGRMLIAIDPAVTSSENANETGIIAGAAGVGKWTGHAFIFRDISGRHAATYWPRLAVRAYHTLNADRIIAEVNNGGDLVESAIRVIDPNVAYSAVHASRGKRARAEPVAALYEQGRVHHVGSEFRELEDQMCAFVPDEREEDPALVAQGISSSPDRVDALVWLLTALLLSGLSFVV